MYQKLGNLPPSVANMQRPKENFDYPDGDDDDPRNKGFKAPDGSMFDSPKCIIKRVYESIAWFEELTHFLDDDDNLKELPIYKVSDDKMKDDAPTHWTQRMIYSY